MDSSARRPNRTMYNAKTKSLGIQPASERADGVREVPGRRPKDVREVSGRRPGWGPRGAREGPGEALRKGLIKRFWPSAAGGADSANIIAIPREAASVLLPKANKLLRV